MVSVVGCATQGQPASLAGVRVQHRLETAGIVRQTASPTSLDSVYDAAVANAAVFRAEHLVSDLWPVPATGSTPMGSFISCDCPGGGGGCSFACAFSPGFELTPSDIWVSRSDQLLRFCRSLPPSLTAAQVVLKIQQLQGLPPQVNPDPCTWKILQLNVVGLKVPNQFFRPCPDPDPTTMGPCPSDFENPVPKATTDFQAWMAGQAFSAWQIPNGYPWTHLGYTYNWDPQAPSIVGTSEYVIRQGVTVNVTGLVPAVPYCTQNRLKCP
ncbi:MAG: hypothetical protein ABUT39_02410 [Acidobacteriota bacterium]